METLEELVKDISEVAKPAEKTAKERSMVLPPELWIHILSELEYSNLIRASRVCHQFHGIIKGDKNGDILKSLFRSVQKFEGEIQKQLDKQQERTNDGNIEISDASLEGDLTSKTEDIWHVFTLNPCLKLLKVKVPFTKPNRVMFIRNKDAGYLQKDDSFEFLNEHPTANENALNYYGPFEDLANAPPAPFIRVPGDIDVSLLNNLTVFSFVNSFLSRGVDSQTQPSNANSIQ